MARADPVARGLRESWSSPSRLQPSTPIANPARLARADHEAVKIRSDRIARRREFVAAKQRREDRLDLQARKCVSQALVTPSTERDVGERVHGFDPIRRKALWVETVRVFEGFGDAL